MKTNTIYSAVALLALITFGSCERTETPIPEIKPSDGNKLTLNGGIGGLDAANAVYVDLSTDKQDSVKRKDWSLGFYCAADFRVILNYQVGMSAIETSQTDIKSVNSGNVDLSKLDYDTKPEKIKLYDDTAGRVKQSVIAEVNATENQNKVYIVNPVFASVKKDELWKVKVTRSGTNAYTLHYAPIDATNIQTLTITKDNAFNFKHVSFSKGAVNVEPKKDDWDFVWTKASFYTMMGPNTPVPYAFSDLIFLNHETGVTADEVVFLDKGGKKNGKPSYDEFDESKLGAINLKAGRNVIGSKWRNTLGTGALKDRFYIIKDKAGNIYKLRFIAMGAGKDGGKRGYPEIEYKLVKGK